MVLGEPANMHHLVWPVEGSVVITVMSWQVSKTCRLAFRILSRYLMYIFRGALSVVICQLPPLARATSQQHGM